MGSVLETALMGSAPDMTVEAEIEIDRETDLDACAVVVCAVVATRVVAVRILVTPRDFVVVRVLVAARTGREHAGSLWRPAHMGRSASATAAPVADSGDRLPAADVAIVPAGARWCNLAPRA